MAFKSIQTFIRYIILIKLNLYADYADRKSTLNKILGNTDYGNVV